MIFFLGAREGLGRGCEKKEIRLQSFCYSSSICIRARMHVCMYLCVNVYIRTRVFTFTKMGEGACNVHQIGRVLFYAARVQLSLFNFNINL